MSELLYNEFQQVGIDFNSLDSVERYDEEMSSFRDFQEEAETIANHIHLGPSDRILEVGTGTGNYALKASKMCKHVYAIDVAQVMLERAKQKADNQKISNITFEHAGFLTYKHTGELFDAIVSNLVLHHLPDFWKQVALMKMNKILKKGGRFYLADQIYSFRVQDYERKLSEWVDLNWERSENLNFKKFVETNVKEEFSTMDWVIEKMLLNAGFSFTKVPSSEFFSIYLATKEYDIELS
ncbi:class I SAM-dependent methyltransferase [Paenibacillus polysaccharolyticus]|uniref:class I SAM-dependent methyltransferase n=1 Tax=Paenibacillus polysaccharolyticus TaxID=582692 RepID=UPI0020420803|nr:class I SAM-dependent methyltransferase [Paenibacillus polysaccharolyticus]MCM3135812.1 class I SAM-dependent methyltransferase [Paenibacillus polysaccharolyticus]